MLKMNEAMSISPGEGIDEISASVHDPVQTERVEPSAAAKAMISLTLSGSDNLDSVMTAGREMAKVKQEDLTEDDRNKLRSEIENKIARNKSNNIDTSPVTVAHAIFLKFLKLNRLRLVALF